MDVNKCEWRQSRQSFLTPIFPRANIFSRQSSLKPIFSHANLPNDVSEARSSPLIKKFLFYSEQPFPHKPQNYCNNYSLNILGSSLTKKFTSFRYRQKSIQKSSKQGIEFVKFIKYFEFSLFSWILMPKKDGL